jgi:hypothetical protein
LQSQGVGCNFWISTINNLLCSQSTRGQLFISCSYNLQTFNEGTDLWSCCSTLIRQTRMMYHHLLFDHAIWFMILLQHFNKADEDDVLPFTFWSCHLYDGETPWMAP